MAVETTTHVFQVAHLDKGHLVVKVGCMLYWTYPEVVTPFEGGS